MYICQYKLDNYQGYLVSELVVLDLEKVIKKCPKPLCIRGLYGPI